MPRDFLDCRFNKNRTMKLRTVSIRYADSS
jgi:hypothetical protein